MAQPRKKQPITFSKAWESHIEDAFKCNNALGRSVELRIGFVNGKRIVVVAWNDGEVEIFVAGWLAISYRPGQKHNPNRAALTKLRYNRYLPGCADYDALTPVERPRVVESVLVAEDQFGNYYVLDAGPGVTPFPGACSLKRPSAHRHPAR
jgi:hypothetical protein